MCSFIEASLGSWVAELGMAGPGIDSCAANGVKEYYTTLVAERVSMNQSTSQTARCITIEMYRVEARIAF